MKTPTARAKPTGRAAVAVLGPRWSVATAITTITRMKVILDHDGVPIADPAPIYVAPTFACSRALEPNVSV